MITEEIVDALHDILKALSDNGCYRCPLINTCDEEHVNGRESPCHTIDRMIDSARRLGTDTAY